MGSESSFDPKIEPPKEAYGLMQLMPETFAYLRDGAKTDLKNHFVDIDKAHYLDPSANIYAGVRWLFRKKSIASYELGRDSTWIEAVVYYKRYQGDPNPGGMERFNNLYEEIKRK